MSVLRVSVCSHLEPSQKSLVVNDTGTVMILLVCKI